MFFYFDLQYRLFKRQLADFGIHPIIGQVILVIIFIGLTTLLFNRTTYAPYILFLGGVYSTSLLAADQRNIFLKSIFKIKKYYYIRWLENLIVTSPFSIALLMHQMYGLSGLLILVASLLSFHTVNHSFSYQLRTPFSRYPFEYTLGFRNTFLLILVAYFLTFMSIKVENFNLGIFAMLLIILNCLSYYVEMEDDFYIWIHKSRPKEFILQKLKIAIWGCILLCLPILIGLTIAYPEHIKILIVFLPLGLLYLTAIVFGKYASYPNKPSLPQAILVGISIFFPPLLIFVIPYFYSKSIHRLNDLLQ